MESPSHSVQIDFQEHQAKVALLSSLNEMDRDFVLLVKQKEPFQPRVWVDSDMQALMVSLYPQFSHEHRACEFIFLGNLDRQQTLLTGG